MVASKNVTRVPPIKSQGIKTKLVPLIRSVVPKQFPGRWVEPFMGTGVVGFNVAPGRALMSDTNPYLVGFYQAVLEGSVTSSKVRDYLKTEGAVLLEVGEAHYYSIRDRFNREHSPLDFLFLNRAGFNGMMRFNRRGEFNIPFCRKPNRFAQAYVTKIVNQVEAVSNLLAEGRFQFAVQSFEQAILDAGEGDLIYCDPPYIDRHTDYFNGWTEKDERYLHELLKASPAQFILSTWAENSYRKNESLKELWSDFQVVTQEHFYHVGGKLENRSSMTEALVISSGLAVSDVEPTESPEVQSQLSLL